MKGGINMENDFSKSWKTLRAFEKIQCDGTDYAVILLENRKSGKKQLVLKKVSVDASGFPMSLAKQIWLPFDDVAAIIKYVQDCLKK